MLKILQSIFGGGEAPGRYPESLIDMAIERAVDGTSPRFRAVPGYRKQLRPAVVTAIDHVIALVDSLPAPLSAASAHYSQTPLLPAFFVSPEQMRQVFGQDLALSELREAHPAGNDPVIALLLAECKEKNTLGVALEGEMLRRDVAQVTVSFGHHRLVDPAIGEDNARRQLKRRAFDHLISLALWRISEAKAERAELHQQRDLLRCKLSLLQKGGWSFAGEEDEGGEAVGPAGVQAALDGIEAQLEGLTVDDRSLNGQLALLIETLTNAASQFWAEPAQLYLDRMNIKCEAQHPEARAINFQMLCNARGERLAMLLVVLDTKELPPREKFSASANRFLAELGGPLTRG